MSSTSQLSWSLLVTRIFTWSSWDPRELGQTLSFSDHHLDALGQRLVLQQDEELAQSPRRTDGTLPVTQRFLGARTLSGGNEGENTQRERERVFLSISRCSLHRFRGGTKKTYLIQSCEAFKAHACEYVSIVVAVSESPRGADSAGTNGSVPLSEGCDITQSQSESLSPQKIN